MALKHTFVSAVADGGDASLVQPSNWNADHVVDGNGLLVVADTSVPSAPAAGNVTLFGKIQADGVMPAYIAPNGTGKALQPFLGATRTGFWSSVGGVNLAPQAIGLVVPVVTGTLTTRTTATTNLFTSTRRASAASAASAGSSAGFRSDKLQFWLGNAAGLGGFRLVIRFGSGDSATVADARSFVGLVGVTTLLGNADPSSNTNIIGVGTDSTETTMSIMHNDGSGVATKVSLGANFPDHTIDTDLYELALFSAPNSGTVGYEVTRLNTGDVARGTITTDLPSTTQLMAIQHWRNNGPTALAVRAELVSAYIETDY